MFARDILNAVHAVKRFAQTQSVVRFYRRLVRSLVGYHSDLNDVDVYSVVDCVHELTLAGVQPENAMFAVHGYDMSLMLSMPVIARRVSKMTAVSARGWYYTGMERNESLSFLRYEAGRLYQLATARQTHAVRNYNTLPVLDFIASLPLHVALKACCVATLCPALPLKEDFA
jgi:hypothetical protein